MEFVKLHPIKRMKLHPIKGDDHVPFARHFSWGGAFDFGAPWTSPSQVPLTLMRVHAEGDSVPVFELWRGQDARLSGGEVVAEGSLPGGGANVLF